MPTNQTIGSGGIAGGTWTIESTNTAQVGRFHDLALLLEGASASSGFTTSRPGVFPGSTDSGSYIPTAMLCAATGSGLNIGVRPGAATVERSTLVGSYIVEAGASGTVTLSTADATNPRIDRVDLQVLDGALGDNSGTSLTRYVVTTGVASGTPAVPSAPSNSIPLCQVLLPANTTTLTSGMFTDKRKSAGLRGGVRMLLPGDALTDTGFVLGELRDNTALVTDANAAGIDRWDGATWRPVSREKSLLSQAASGILTLATTVQDVPGASITLTTVASNTVVRFQAQFDWRLITTGTGYCYGQVALDGSTVGRADLDTAQSAETRLLTTLIDDVVIATPGSHTIKMQGHCDTSSGSATFDSASTKLFLAIANQ